ncbi:MAG: alpha/beta hydrolase [Anaerolineales bacterium]|nr:alpha/beta hydrolase [Anaerolineales bacterium]
MSSIPTLPGITSQMIQTARLNTHVLSAGSADDTAVLFIHGNTSSATFWEETMLTLPEGYFALAPDLRGYGDADPTAKIDATQGLRDVAEDMFALLDAFNIEQAHVVGNSLGGVVVWRMMEIAPERLLSVTQVAPGSPYGFGGTKDVDGTPTTADFAGSGAGLINPAVVQAIAAQDRSLENPMGLRGALRRLVYNPPFVPEREEDLLTAALSTHIGEQDYPGDKVASPNWPFVAPGVWGPNNALSPKYAGDVSQLWQIEPKPPVLWVWGEKDGAVSNTAVSDIANLGQLGYIHGYPGTEAYPPQPMIDQIRAVLHQYTAHGGQAKEVMLPGLGHVPYIEDLEQFNTVFHPFLAKSKK